MLAVPIDCALLVAFNNSVYKTLQESIIFQRTCYQTECYFEYTHPFPSKSATKPVLLSMLLKIR